MLDIDDYSWFGVTTPLIGGLRLSNLQIVIDQTIGKVSMPPVEIELRGDVWHKWFRIAQRHRDPARVARDASPGIGADLGEKFRENLEAEFLGGMISLCAADRMNLRVDDIRPSA